MAVVEITGVRETQQNLGITEIKIFEFVKNVIEEVLQKGTQEAQKQCPVDTGALKASTEGAITRIEQGILVEGQVGAGSDKVIRGEGNFEFSPKQNKKVTRQPTSEYAEMVEEKSRFMATTFQYLKDLTPRQIVTAINKALRGLV